MSSLAVGRVSNEDRHISIKAARSDGTFDGIFGGGDWVIIEDRETVSDGYDEKVSGEYICKRIMPREYVSAYQGLVGQGLATYLWASDQELKHTRLSE